MTSIGELSVDLKLDTSELDQEIAGLGNQYKDFKIPVRFDGGGLEREFKQYRDKFRSQSVSVSVRLKLDTQSVTQLRQQIQSQADVAVRVRMANNFSDVKLKIDENSLRDGLRPAVSGVGDEVAEQISKGFKKIKGGGLSSFLTAPFRNIIRGFQEGVGITYSQKLTSGFIKNFESEIGTSLNRVGNNIGKYFTTLGKGVGNRVLQKAGFEQGLEDLKPKLLEVRSFFDEIVDTNVIDQKLNVVETRIIKFFDDIIRLKPLDTTVKNLFRVGESVGDIATTPFEGLKKRKRRVIRERAAEIKKGYEPGESGSSDVPEEAKYIVLASGGFAGEQGKSSDWVAQKLGALLGNDYHVTPIRNPGTDVSESVGKQGALRWTAESGMKIASHGMEGINPDSVEMARKAYEMYQETQKPVRLVGYSAGGFVAHDAAEILKQLKVPVKAIGLGTPHWGKTSSLNADNYQTILREEDGVTTLVKKLEFLLGRVSGEKTNITPGFGHELATYLSEPVAQSKLLSFLEGKPTEAKADFLNPEAFRIFDYKKNIEKILEGVESSLTSPLSDPATQEAILKQTFEGIKELRSELDKSLADLSDDLKQGMDDYLGALEEAQGVLADILGITNEIEVSTEIDVSQQELAKEAANVDEKIESALAAKPVEVKTQIDPDLTISEEDLVKEVRGIQNQLTASFKQAFKGKGKDKVVVDQQLAETSLSVVTEQIARLDKIKQQRQLTGKTAQDLGRIKGTLENQYRSYSPKIREGQPGTAASGVKESTSSNIGIKASLLGGVGAVGSTLLGGGGAQAATLGGTAATGGSLISTLLSLLASPAGAVGAAGLAGVAGIAGARAARPILEPIAPVLYKDVKEIAGTLGQKALDRVTQLKIAVAGITPPNIAQKIESQAEKIAPAFQKIVGSFPKIPLLKIEVPEGVKELAKAFAAGSELRKNFGETVELVRNFGNKILPGLGDSVVNFGAAFLSLQALKVIKDVLWGVIQAGTEVAIKFEGLETSLKFVSGGSAKAAQSLAMVRQEAKRLNTPLQSSLEGFTKFASAVKGTTLESSSQGIFKGISQGIAVSQLGTEEAQGVFVAVQQMAAKSKISAEEFRQQLSERLPMSAGIAARSLGVTTEEFARMLDTGQLLSQDFLPRFAAQMAAETESGVAGSANTGQAALNRFNNSLLDLQLAVGKSALPIQKLGLGLLSGAIDTAAQNGQALTQILSGLAVVVGLQLIPPFFGFLKSLPVAQSLMGGLSSSLGILSAAAKTMAVQFAMIYGAIELFKLGDTLINGGDLSKDFKQLENAARDAAKGIRDVKDAKGELSNQAGNAPPPANWSDSAIMGLRSAEEDYFKDNPLLDKAMGGRRFWGGLTTYAELDRDKAIESIYKAGEEIIKAKFEIEDEIRRAKKGQSKLNLLPAIDDELLTVSQNRKILQAQIKREYTEVGKAVPPELKEKLAQLNTQFSALSQQRADVAKPFADKLTQYNKAIDYYKTQLERLETAEGRQFFTGQGVNIDELKAELSNKLSIAKTAKQQLETLTVSSKADPILELAQAFRKLNVELADNAEKSTKADAARQQSMAQEQLSGFSKDPLAAQKASVKNAQRERDKALRDMQDLERSLAERKASMSQGNVAPILAELKVDGDTSSAKLQDLIDNEPDENKKKILERLRSIKDDELKVSQSKIQIAQNELTVKQQIEAAATADLAKNVADREALIKREENVALTKLTDKKFDPNYTPEQLAEESAKIQLTSTKRQIESVEQQKSAYRELYEQGKLSAAEYVNKERELTSQLSDFKKQKAEQEVAAREAANARILADLEFANQKAAAAIALKQNESGLGIKSRQLSGGLNETDATQQLEDAQQATLAAEIEGTRKKLADLAVLESSGVKSKREAMLERLQLQQTLGQQQLSLLDSQLSEEKRLRDEANADADHAQELEKSRNLRAIRERYLAQGIDERGAGRLTETEGQAALALEIQRTQEKLKQNISDQERRGLESQLEQQLTQELEGRINLSKRDREDRVNAIDDQLRNEQRLTEEKAYQLDLQSKELDLLQKSDDLTKTLLDSRRSLSKALSDAGMVGAEQQLEQVKRAEELRTRLTSEENIPANVRRTLEAQLRGTGFAGKDEKALMESRFAIENRLAAMKAEAQKAEQEHAQIMQEFELRRTELAARQAFFAAKRADLEARSAESSATKELEKANEMEPGRERDRAVADAKAKLGQSREGLGIAREEIQMAQSVLDSQSQLSDNARKTLDTTQQMERSQSASAEASRRNAQELERAEKAAKGLAASEAGRVLMSTTLRVGSKEWEQRQQASQAFSGAVGKVGDQKANLIQAAMSMKNNPFFDMMLSANGMGDIAGLTSELKSKGVDAVKMGSVAANSRMGNRDVVDELKKLNENIGQLANRPTSLHVNSTNPVRDAAGIYGDMGRQSIRSTNL